MKRNWMLIFAALAVCAAAPAATVSAQTDPLSQSGRFRAGFRSVTVTRPNATTFTARLYYPAAATGQNAAYDGSGAPYPAITFGHGFLQSVATYQSTLEHLATHGYFVIASESEGGLFPSHQNFANDLRFSLDHLTQQNADPGSQLFGQVATARYGASGHSMGGGASVLAAAQDTRIRALANLAAADTNPSAIAAMPSVTAPSMLISGSADTIVPIGSNGQLMYNGGPLPKLLPVIQGGWHCGFQEANGFGCDTGTIARAEQLRETRRLLTAFFDLYLARDESNWRHVWGPELRNPLVTAQASSGIDIAPAAQTLQAPVGRETTFSITVTNRSAITDSYRIFVDQRRWAVRSSAPPVVNLAPNQSTQITFSVRRLWKNLPIVNQILISARRVSDDLTRNYAVVTLGN